MAIDWKTIISEFDGKPTLLQAIGKLRKAVEDETITIQQAQAEIAKLESQQKADEALITTADTKAQNAQSAAQAADTKAQQALDLATTNKQGITKLNREMVFKVDKIEQSTGDIVYAVSNNEQTFFNVSGWEIKPLSIVRRDNDGNIRANGFLLPSGAKFENNSFVTKGRKKISYPEPSGDTYFSTNESVLKIVNDLKFKTLFGNQIKGSGNIDLYRHEISYGAINDGITITVNFEHYSSNNLKANSLTGVKTLLGNTFKKGIFGSITITATGKALTPLYINETNIFYIGEDGSVQSQTLSGTFTDTVTAI